MAPALRLLGEPLPVTTQTLPVLAKGFRPFFLLAALHATVFLPVWLLVLSGAAAPPPYFDAASWHAHEMLFGFTVAVIAGFLLTAVGNWTGRETAVGRWLGALCTVWLAGRLAVLMAPWLPRGVPAALDLAFLPMLALAIGRPLAQAKNRRNYVMLAVLLALFAANLAMHLDALGVKTGVARPASLAALDLVVVVMLVIGGRVFPMFTRNATGIGSIRSHPKLDIASVVSMLAVAIADGASLPARWVGALCLLASLLAIARAVHWGAQHSMGQPLLWVLHLGYAWIPLGLFLRFVAAYVHYVQPGLPFHALTVGAIGGLTLGMMARVSLGHTGRALSPPRPMGAAFALVMLAAVVRVAMPWLLPMRFHLALELAGGAWVLAFMIFLVCYARFLVQPRVDGKPG